MVTTINRKLYMDQDSRFVHYRQLLKRVDEKFSEILNRNRNHFQCGKGCFGCCKSGFTVTHVEAAHIRLWLRENPSVVEKIKTAITQNNHGSEFCSALDKDGGCLIYDVRPIICRSHGAPVLIPNESDERTFDGDVCPLNFSEIELGSLTQADWIRLDTLNTILSRVDLEFDCDSAGVRVDLRTIFAASDV